LAFLLKGRRAEQALRNVGPRDAVGDWVADRFDAPEHFVQANKDFEIVASMTDIGSLK